MSELEREALDAAYVKAFGRLFDVLISGWMNNEAAALERFGVGLNIQREAYEEVKRMIGDADA